MTGETIIKGCRVILAWFVISCQQFFPQTVSFAPGSGFQNIRIQKQTNSLQFVCANAMQVVSRETQLQKKDNG